MKKCIKCNQIKKKEDFYKNHKMADSRLNACRSCHLEYSANFRKDHDKKIYSQYGIGRRTITTYGMKLALEVYDRAKRKCEQCGGENDLTIHHLNGKGRHYQEKGGIPDNDNKNLVVWCRKCHGSFHGKQGKGIKKS